jgi:iron complex transport system permease protein
VGAALAAAGAIFQSVIRNPLGDPFLLGVSSGAALGMVLAMSLGIGGYLAGIPIAALVGGLTAILVVYILAKSGGKIHTTRLILAGIVVSSYGSALTMLILARSESATVRGITFWMMGDLSYHGLSDLAMLFPMAAIIIFIIFTFSGKLNVLILGDDVARQLGLPVEFLKLIAIFAASLLTGLAVAAAGVVGFVGLVVPNLVRFIWGSDFRMNFILSTFSGALLVSGADIIVKLITPVSQLPIGIVTALIGAPFFIYLLVSARD